MSSENESTRETSGDDDFFSGRWVRKATDVEKMYNLCTRLKMKLLWLQVRLKSRNPLAEDQIRVALNHLYRKCPALNHCFGTHNGEVWIRRAINPEIDFEVLHGKSVSYVRRLLQTHHYNTVTGPLFSARLLLNPPPHEITKDDDDPEPQFHNEYLMFFGFPHNLVDAKSNHIIVKYFLTLLNDVISNNAIDDEPWGVLVGDEPIFDLEEEKMRMIREMDKLVPEVSEESKWKLNFVPDHRHFAPMSVFDTDQVTMIKIFYCKTTSEITAKRKKESVSLASFFVALVNVAIVELLSENGVMLESYGLKARYLNDERKYWKAEIPDSLGVHVALSSIYKDTPRHAYDTFWEYARSVHKKLRRDVISGKTFLQRAYAAHQGSPMTVWNEENLLQTQPITTDYVMSSMGDITPIVTTGGEHVRITHLLEGTLRTPCNNVFVVQNIIFRGKLCMQFDSKKTVVQPGLIERLFEITLQKMKGVLSKE